MGQEPREDLLALLAEVERLEELARTRPLDFIPWLPGQLAWLSDPGPKPKLYRAGVRSGKTTAACAEVIWRCLGTHPYHPTPTPPVRCAVVTTDKQAQGLAIQRLFWEIVPKDELAPGTDFNSRTGFRGHVPVVRFRNGSEVVWYSDSSGPRAIQGSEFHYIQIDEPCSRELYDECRARVRNTGGQVGITLTPMHLPVPWLQAMCDEGLVSDHHFTLTEANQTSPITGKVRTTKTGVPWDQAFIDDLRNEERGPDAGIKLDGDWEMRSEGQFFKVFESDKHVSSHLPDAELSLHLGIDYAGADRELGMCAVLSGVQVIDVDGEKQGHVWVLDECVMPGTATMGQFASGVLKMLASHGITWRELDSVFGDIPVKTRWQTSSNVELGKAIAKQLKLQYRALRPRPLAVKEGGGASWRARSSKDLRCRWFYSEIAHDRVRIHPRCTTLIKAFETWDYGDRHPYKDVLDAAMYGLKDLWATKRRTTVPRLMLR